MPTVGSAMPGAATGRPSGRCVRSWPSKNGTTRVVQNIGGGQRGLAGAGLGEPTVEWVPITVRWWAWPAHCSVPAWKVSWTGTGRDARCRTRQDRRGTLDGRRHRLHFRSFGQELRAQVRKSRRLCRRTRRCAPGSIAPMIPIDRRSRTFGLQSGTGSAREDPGLRLGRRRRMRFSQGSPSAMLFRRLAQALGKRHKGRG